MLLTAGALSSTCQHDGWEIARLYFSVYLACWVAAWECYWIGRLLGPKLFNFRWFRKVITPYRLDKIKDYIHRFGILTFIVGRFIPGGRNALFMSTGFIRMSFPSFILRDSIGCFFSTATVFSLGYFFGSHYQQIVEIFKMYQMIFLGFIFVLLFLGAAYLWKSKAKISI